MRSQIDGSQSFGSSIDELLELELEHEEWVVDPFLPAGGRMLLYGETGVGKSQVAMTMALAVLQGLPFLDKFGTTRGNVCYIQADMPLVEWKERIQLSTKHLPTTSGFFQIFCAETLNILEEARHPERSQFREWIIEFGPKLVIVDVLSETHQEDENDNSVPGPVYNAWKKIVGTQAGILFVHHEKKPAEYRNNKYSFSGAHKWLDLCSSSLRVSESRNQIFLENPKAARNAARADKIALDRDPQTLLVRPAGKPVEVAFRQMMEAGKTKSEIVAEVTDINKYKDGIIPKTTAYRRFKEVGYDV